MPKECCCQICKCRKSPHRCVPNAGRRSHLDMLDFQKMRDEQDWTSEYNRTYRECEIEQRKPFPAHRTSVVINHGFKRSFSTSNEDYAAYGDDSYGGTKKIIPPRSTIVMHDPKSGDKQFYGLTTYREEYPKHENQGSPTRHSTRPSHHVIQGDRFDGEIEYHRKYVKYPFTEEWECPLVKKHLTQVALPGHNHRYYDVDFVQDKKAVKVTTKKTPKSQKKEKGKQQKSLSDFAYNNANQIMQKRKQNKPKARFNMIEERRMSQQQQNEPKTPINADEVLAVRSSILKKGNEPKSDKNVSILVTDTTDYSL